MIQDANRILIEIDDATSGTTRTLAGQTEASISFTKSLREYTSKTTTDANGVAVRKYLPSRFEGTISCSALYDPSGDLSIDEIAELCYNGTKVKFLLGADEVGSKAYSGEGWLNSTNLSFSLDENSSGDFEITVDGGIEIITVS